MVTMDQANFLEDLLSILDSRRIRYCVIGGQGVNAYVEPLVSLDLDLAIATEQLSEVESLMKSRYRVEVFPHSLNVSAPESGLRVQIQTDPRYASFVDRASIRDVLGLALPVASIEDVLQGKVWAATDPERRPSKRRKDLLDIERLLESYPGLRSRVPPEILERLAED
jgi:hypothetical protein